MNSKPWPEFADVDGVARASVVLNRLVLTHAQLCEQHDPIEVSLRNTNARVGPLWPAHQFTSPNLIHCHTVTLGSADTCAHNSHGPTLCRDPPLLGLWTRAGSTIEITSSCISAACAPCHRALAAELLRGALDVECNMHTTLLVCVFATILPQVRSVGQRRPSAALPLYSQLHGWRPSLASSGVARLTAWPTVASSLPLCGRQR